MADKHLALILFLVSGTECGLAQTLQAPASAARAIVSPSPTPPQKRGDRPAPSATSVPASPVAAPLSAGPILNTPSHSPDQLDFGPVADGSSQKKTFFLTTNAPGYVTANIAPGPFRIVEFREMGPVQGASKNPGGQSPAIASGAVRSRIRYQEGQTGPFQWSMAPHVEMQLDIVFAPKIQVGSAGPKSAIMNMTGPGPHGNWALTIPLRGNLSSLKVAPEPPQPKAAGNDIRHLMAMRCIVSPKAFAIPDQQENQPEIEPSQPKGRLYHQDWLPAALVTGELR